VKQYYFISGLPRSGSTLLSGILKQNPNFYADIASPLEALTEASIDVITSAENNLTVSEDQRKNLLYGIFDGYYQHINKPAIFDSSRHWTKKTNLLRSLFPYTKIICPVRDIVSILNSFEVISSKNPFHTKTLTKLNDNVFERCDEMMDKNSGVVASSWISLQEGYALNPEMIYFIEYDNLCKEPERTMRGVYEFLEKPYYSHDFENIEYSNENFDRACNLKDLHTVKKKVEYKPPRCVLPREVVKRFKELNMEFWRENNKTIPDIVEKLDENFYEYK
jgi:sulfotransferase|tara:strand:- start:5531 stop:6364 length:834 start_codon:yes stop_codon:yes gene_type:complete